MCIFKIATRTPFRDLATGTSMGAEMRLVRGDAVDAHEVLGPLLRGYKAALREATKLRVRERRREGVATPTDGELGLELDRRIDRWVLCNLRWLRRQFVD